MTYGQQPPPLGKWGSGPTRSSQGQPDPAFIRAIAEFLRGGSPDQGAAEQGYQQDAASARQQYGIFNDGSPNALQGGKVAPFDPAYPFGPEIYPNPDYPPDTPGPTPGDYGGALMDTFRDLSQNREPQANEGGGLLGAIGRGALELSSFWPMRYADAKEALASRREGMEGWPPPPPAFTPSEQNPNLSQDALDQARGEDLHDTLTGVMSNAAAPKPKKKSEFSDFFSLLKRAKSDDGSTKKKLAELAKQLDDEDSATSASGGTIPVA